MPITSTVRGSSLGNWRTGWILDQPSGSQVPQQLGQEISTLNEEFEAIWHARNRPGGFKDSVARLELLSIEYAAAQRPFI